MSLNPGGSPQGVGSDEQRFFEISRSKSHVQFGDRLAPKESNCIGTVRVEYAEAFRKAVESVSLIANRCHSTQDQTGD